MNSKVKKIHKINLSKLMALLLCVSIFLAGCSLKQATAEEMGADADEWINVGDIRDEVPQTDTTTTNTNDTTTTNTNDTTTTTNTSGETPQAIPSASPMSSPPTEGRSLGGPSITPFAVVNFVINDSHISSGTATVPTTSGNTYNISFDPGITLPFTTLNITGSGSVTSINYANAGGLTGITTSVSTNVGNTAVSITTTGNITITGTPSGTIDIGTNTVIVPSGSNVSGTTGTAIISGTVNIMGGNPNITSNGNLTITGTTSGTITANAGHTVTLPISGTWNVAGTGTVNIGVNSTATINASSTETLTIAGSTTGAGVINGGAGTIKLPSTGGFNIAGGTFNLNNTSGTITLAGSTNISGGTSATAGEIDTTAAFTATITDSGSYRIKGNVALGTGTPTVIATGNVKVTGTKATIKATGNHVLDLTGTNPTSDGDIVVDYVDSSNAPKIKLPLNGKKITIKNATTIQVDLTTPGPINLNIDSTAAVIVDFINGNATGATITSNNLTNLTIKSTTNNTITGTVDVKGATKLTDLTVENATGSFIVDVPSSTTAPAPSPFTNLTIKGAITDLKVTVNGASSGFVNTTTDRGHTTPANANVIPNFTSLTLDTPTLVSLDLTNCGIESNFTLNHTGTVAIDNLKLGGNGFTNDIFTSWVNTKVTGLKTIDLSGSPSQYTKWANSNISPPTLVGTSIELKTKDLHATSTALTTINLGGAGYVSTLTMDTNARLTAAVATVSHSGLTINISNDTTTTHTITQAIKNLYLTNNEYTTWTDARINIENATVSENLHIKNAAETLSTSGTIDFSTIPTTDTKNIVVHSNINTITPKFKLGNGTQTFEFDDKNPNTASGTPLFTIEGIGTGTSSLNKVTLGSNTGKDFVDFKYEKIIFPAPVESGANPSRGLPVIIGWTANTSADKQLILSGINITHMGKFYGENHWSGNYLSSRGYDKLGKIDITGEKLAHLNIRDQASTIHTLKFNDKSELLTYNLNGCDKLVNGTTTGSALTEVFNVYDTGLTGGKLTHVDYSGCTQLAQTGGLTGGTLQLHNNKIVVAYMDFPTSTLVRNINISGNKLTTATSAAFTGSSGASGDSGLCLGANTVFHSTDSVLNISSNNFNKVDLERDLKVVNLAISQGSGASGTIANGVTVKNQTELTNINLSSNTVATILDLSQNSKLESLWGTTNNHGTYSADPDFTATTGTPNNMATDIDKSLNIIGELNLESSHSLYGTDGGIRFLEFNNVSGKNDHKITKANLNKTSAQNVQINYNDTLHTLILTERVDATGVAPGDSIVNLEVVGNIIKKVYSGTGAGDGLHLPADKTKLSKHVRIDTNPLESVVIDGYNGVTFVGLSNTAAPKEAVPSVVAGSLVTVNHRISGGVTIINIANLEIVDITNNEIFKLNLSNNAVLNSILGTLSVTSGTTIPTIGATSALNGATALLTPSTAGIKDASMVDEEINLSKSAGLDDKMIFNGHHIKFAYLSENDFELVDLRRNDGKGESASENDSPTYRDKNDEFRGVLEFVDISKNAPGKEIGDLFFDENKLKIIDSTATAQAGTSVLMTDTKFKPGSYLTANKNDIETVIIKPGNGTNVENSMKEIQLNDNKMKILHAIDMKVLELIKVNRTVKDKNDFIDGSVILKGSDKLKEFAPATVVEDDGVVNENISRRRPSRPNESYWNIDRAFSDAGVNFTLTHIPLDSFGNLGGTASKPISVKYKDAFAPAVNNTGYYHYVPIAELDITGCTDLVTLRVAGNYLTDGRMNLGGTSTPNIEFLDISGKHDITENSENGKYMVPGERMTQEDYLYGSLFASHGYRDGKSGQLGKSVGSFVSQWPKAQHIYIQNNSYGRFDVGTSAGSARAVLAFNNNMTSVEVSSAALLQVLDVERNAIAPTITLPTPNLLIFRAGHNLISEYPNTPSVQGLQEIYLDNNNFPEKSISRSTASNPDLKVINLSNNRFRVFEDFTANLKLEEIYLFNNDTLNLPKVALNGNVKVFDIHLNKIENIRDEDLPNSLRYFDISDNKLQKFTLTKIPAGMASMDSAITAHEVIPSHMTDPSMTYFNGDRRGFIGTINISNNQLSYITDEYDVAWAAFDANSPTSVMRFLLDYNLLDIDKYDRSKPEHLKGRQKWLASSKEGCIDFILTVTPEDRRMNLVKYLAYFHPLRGTYEKAPSNATYDIWFDDEIEYGPNYIEQSNRNIHQTIEYINMYAAVSTPDTRPPFPNRYGSDISNIVNPFDTKNAVTPGQYAGKNVARNNVAVVKACLYGPNTDLLPWEDVFGSKFKGGTTGKAGDITLSGGRYNPVTGPNN